MNMQSALHKSAVVGFSAMALSMFAFSAQANLITNGEFSLFTSGGTNSQIQCLNCNPSSSAVLKNWTNNDPLAFVYGPNAADITGATSAFPNHPFLLWGPNSGAPSHNTFDGYSPNQINEDLTVNLGVNFVALDADPTFPQRTISQTINTGLVTGQQYVLSYHWAAAQYTDSTGATDSGWGVTLGSQKLLNGYLIGAAAAGAPSEIYASISSQGFSGWYLSPSPSPIPAPAVPPTLLAKSYRS